MGKFKFNYAMVVPAGGWAYVVVGLIWPLQHWFLIFLWWIILFLSVVVHGAQLLIALPVGRHHNISAARTVLYTIVFGATWWKPLQSAMQEKVSIPR